MQWCANQYKQNFCYTQKELLQIPAEPEQRYTFLRKGYESFLNCAKIKGALLNNVNSSLLLPKEEFVLYCKDVLSRQAKVCYTDAEEPSEPVSRMQTGKGK